MEPIKLEIFINDKTRQGLDSVSGNIGQMQQYMQQVISQLETEMTDMQKKFQEAILGIKRGLRGNVFCPTVDICCFALLNSISPLLCSRLLAFLWKSIFLHSRAIYVLTPLLAPGQDILPRSGQLKHCIPYSHREWFRDANQVNQIQ